MIRLFSGVILLLAVSNQVTISQRSVLPCRTPQNRIGQCIPLGNCKELIWLIQNKGNDPSAMRYLKNARCSSGTESPKVCCTSTSAITVRMVAPDTEQCGSVEPKVNQKIIGGKDAQLGDYPWMATLGYRKHKSKGTEWFCGGALVSKKYVLTAAHCVSGISPWELYKVRLGDLNLNESVDDDANPMDVFIERTIVHEKYSNSPVMNDIALIRLRKPVSYDEYIKPICLPLYREFRTRSLNREKAYVAGWGKTSLNGPFSAALQDLVIPILDIEYCKKAYLNRPGSYVDHRNLCAGYLNGKKDSCQGDSGGPLMWLNQTDSKFYVVGIVSFGFKCAEKGFPGVYTKVSEYADWIALNIY